MRRLASTRFGFFALAAAVCWSTLFVIEREHRWVALGVGGLYAVLSVLFYLEEASRPSIGERRADEPEMTPPETPFEPPPSA